MRNANVVKLAHIRMNFGEIIAMLTFVTLYQSILCKFADLNFHRKNKNIYRQHPATYSKLQGYLKSKKREYSASYRAEKDKTHEEKVHASIQIL